MPITHYLDDYTISGTEAEQLRMLHQKIQNRKSIESLLKEINPKNLEILVNHPISYNISLENKDYFTSVTLAAKCGNLAALKLLSAVGANFNVFTSHYGDSPLHLAAKGNFIEVIDYLVKEKKIDVNLQTAKRDYYPQNITPLCSSTACGHLEASNKLLSLGANVNYQDNKGLTPLHHACYTGFTSQPATHIKTLVQSLLKAGANPFLQGKIILSISDNKTALEIIASSEDKIMIQQVIDENLSPNAPGGPTSTQLSTVPATLFSSPKKSDTTKGAVKEVSATLSLTAGCSTRSTYMGH
jgi:ankyrin repeat protein